MNKTTLSLLVSAALAAAYASPAQAQTTTIGLSTGQAVAIDAATNQYTITGGPPIPMGNYDIAITGTLNASNVAPVNNVTSLVTITGTAGSPYTLSLFPTSGGLVYAYANPSEGGGALTVAGVLTNTSGSPVSVVYKGGLSV